MRTNVNLKVQKSSNRNIIMTYNVYIIRLLLFVVLFYRFKCYDRYLLFGRLNCTKYKMLLCILCFYY